MAVSVTLVDLSEVVKYAKAVGFHEEAGVLHVIGATGRKNIAVHAKGEWSHAEVTA